MIETHLLIPYRGVAGQVAGQASQVGQVVGLLANQVDKLNRGVSPEVDKMVEDKVGIEIDQEVGAKTEF